MNFLSKCCLHPSEMHSSCLMKQSEDRKTDFPCLPPPLPTVARGERKVVKQEETIPGTLCGLVINSVL